LSADISDRHLCVRFGLKMNGTSTYDEVGLARKTPYALLAKDTFKPPEGQRLSPVEPQNHLLMHQFPDDHQYTSGPSEEEIPSGFQEEHQQPQHGLRGITNSVPEKLQENRLFSVGISIPEATGAFDKTSRVSESSIKALQKSSQLLSNESEIKNFKLKNPEVRSQLNRMSTHELIAWIKSKGVPVGAPYTLKRLLARAELLWDAIENGTHGDLILTERAAFGSRFP
jgi:hypothetical protein